ncbi:MAG: exopolyphosphatase [Acidobacteriota bacterium]|nr:MAG: exopolyphosphatase [Acidobacteriota bacterium]
MIGAVDLGSNSFHMLVARLVGDAPQVVDQLRERVRLAGGLDSERRLSASAEQRALACLFRFGQRLRDLPAQRVRAVATNTLRQARDADSFRARAEAALGHPIEIVSGQEEARLIYLGVAHTFEGRAGRLLVVDIGGGSTELIIGEKLSISRAHSLFMGCVGFSQRFFRGGRLTRDAFRQATLAARLELRPIERLLKRAGWQVAVGASGTINAVAEIGRQSGWSEAGVTAAGLVKLRKAMIACGRTSKLALAGLKADRAPVLAGGVAVLEAVFEALEIETMACSSGALREGVLYDLVGRIQHDDARERTIRSLMSRFHVDVAQAARVERVARQLLAELREPWKLTDPQAERLVSWAARLLEVGLAVSYSGYHKHGAYLVRNTDMPGFSADEQKVVSALIRAHRRKLSKAYFADLPAEAARSAVRLCVILRLAFVMCRSRSSRPAPPVRVEARKKRVRLVFPQGWLREHPLTHADLEAEAGPLGSIGFELLLAPDEGLPPHPPGT